MIIALTIISVAILGALLANLYLTYKGRAAKQDSGETLVLHQRLDALTQVMSEQLQGSSRAIADQLEKTRQASERATDSVSRQVQSFTQNMTQIQENMKSMHESVKDISSFQNIFKSPKLRGIWGEQSLEASLQQYFSRDLYELQHYFRSGEAVDAALKLPSDLLLPIDAKFNWENFEKMVNAENDMQRDIHRRAFYGDVKKKIDEIANKYILPSEGTTDLALMYVPAETVYYEIINNIKDVDIPSYARAKKVFLVSPNTFALSISAIRHWFKDVEFNKQTKDIMKRLERIAIDGSKLAEGFRKLGAHLANARSAYDDSEKRVGLLVDRVQNVIEMGEKESLDEPHSEPPSSLQQ
ncbi:MAG TPA: DNA recombination protein RmuC [Candidatus Paceibacterota bacterium]|nr:DNA recombination protein RmuC [Candidatus Paceibacterota bacterium]